jgi:hypothetical protein
MPLRRVGGAARLRPRLTAGVAKRPWVGLPATSRFHPWLGDRRVPSRRCAGAGSRPVCARSRVDCGRGPTPPAWSPGASRLNASATVTRCSSLCNYPMINPRPGGGAPDSRPAPAVRLTRASGRQASPPVGGVVPLVVLSAPGPLERARRRLCAPGPRGVWSARRAVLLPCGPELWAPAAGRRPRSSPVDTLRWRPCRASELTRASGGPPAV